MTDVTNRFADGQFSSTILMQQALEEAHVIEKGEGTSLAWHADHETMDQARARMHDEPAKVTGEVLGDLAGHYVKHGAITGLKAIATSALEGVTGLSAGAAAAKLGLQELAVAGAPEIAGAALVAAPIVLIVRACNQDEELETKAKVDALDVAVMNLVDVDPGFRLAEMKKYPSINAQTATRFFADLGGHPTAFGKVHLPELQAAADSGSKAAFEAMRCGGRDAFVRLHPDMAKRLENDIAFNKGFESVMWCAAQPDRDTRLNAIQSGIDARNVQSARPHRIQG